MRRLCTFLLASALLITVSGAQAEVFKPHMKDTPESYKAARYGADEVRDNIKKVECGGFLSDTSAQISGNNVTGDMFIPDIRSKTRGGDITPGLPGHTNIEMLGQAATGLGKRSDFQFPDSAYGYISSCDIRKNKVFDADLAEAGMHIGLEEGGGELGSGFIEVNPNKWCLVYQYTAEGELIRDDKGLPIKNPENKATPYWCLKLYKRLKELADSAPRFPLGEGPQCEPLDGAAAEKKYCLDDTRECYGEECHTLKAPDYEDVSRRCEYGGDDVGWIKVSDGKHRSVVSSFFRHYGMTDDGASLDDKIKQANVKISAPEGGSKWDVRGECYDYYKPAPKKDPNDANEALKDPDTKNILTNLEWEQCELVTATPSEQEPDTPEWKPKKSDSNGNAQKSGEKPKQDEQNDQNTGGVKEPKRDERKVPDPWVADTETNLNLVDAKKIKDQAAEDGNTGDAFDLAAIMATILPTKQRAAKSPQQARTDMFDDTDHRAFAAFWEAQQKELLKMMTAQKITVILPSRGLLGMKKDDPMFRYVTGVTAKPGGVVAVTLRAGPEDIGNVLESYARAAIAPDREVRIPLLVGLASDEEIQSLIADWKLWKEGEKRDSDDGKKRQSYEAYADPLIAKLESYKEAIRKERLMRGALANYLKKLFDNQKKIQDFVATWFKAKDQQTDEAKKLAADRATLQAIWRKIQNSLLKTDECQLQWCSNQRYSVGVYSLIDAWWSKQPFAPTDKKISTSPRDATYTPAKEDPKKDLTTLNYKVPTDQVYDFSNMAFSATGYSLPVLWPVQIKIKLPRPPDIGAKPPSPDEFPDLPDYPDADIFADLPIPAVTLPEPPKIEKPEYPDLTQAITMLRDIRTIVDGTKPEDQLNDEADPEQDDFPVDDPTRDSLRGAYCRLAPSIMLPPKEQETNYKKIIHVENELHESAARLFARWMPNTAADLAGRTARLKTAGEQKCHEGVVCIFLPAEHTHAERWQWFVPTQKDVFTPIAEDLRDSTLPQANEENPDESKNPFEGTDIPTLKRIFPNLPIPIIIDLKPGASSSSAPPK